MKKSISLSLFILSLVSLQSLNAATGIFDNIRKAAGNFGRGLTKPLPMPTSSIDEQREGINSIKSQIATLAPELKSSGKTRGMVRRKILANAPEEASKLNAEIGKLGKQMGGLAGQRTQVRNRLEALFGTKSGEVLQLKPKLTDYDTKLSNLGKQKRDLELELDNLLIQYSTPAQMEELTTLDKLLNQLGIKKRTLEVQLDSILKQA